MVNVACSWRMAGTNRLFCGDRLKLLLGRVVATGEDGRSAVKQ
jgi:hypothetical protein